jgi:DNA repair exonuclease SbcCD ATPase subunit
MWRYLKEAFWFNPDLPGVGRFPINVAAVAGFLILGFGHEGFWLLGLGLETGYLAMLATNPRFQRLVQIRARRMAAQDDESRMRSLIDALPAEARARLRRLEEQCERLARLRSGGDGALSVEVNRQALKRIDWLFLKLLVAQHHLQSADEKADAARLEAERRQIEEELSRSDLSEALRRSKEATLRILTQRCANAGRQAQALEEIASDLKRVEEQVKLALEEARLKGDDSALTSFDVHLESQLLEDSYGSAGPHVAALDQRYQNPARIKR